MQEVHTYNENLQSTGILLQRKLEIMPIIFLPSLNKHGCDENEVLAFILDVMINHSRPEILIKMYL